MAIAKAAVVAESEIWGHSVAEFSPVKGFWKQHLPCICIAWSYAVNKPLKPLGVTSNFQHPQGH